MKTRLILFSLFVGSFTIIHAQNVNSDVCNNGDCLAKIFAIQLNQSRLIDVTVDNAQRTQEFMDAYLEFQAIKKEHSGKSGWQSKYDGFQLGGKNCVRYYQLESWFAYEYEQNPAFARFIEAKADVDAFKKSGWRSSHRGMNLYTRMRSKCPQDVEDLKNAKGSKTEDMAPVYKKLGIVQGYFDEDGNPLKPLEEPVIATAPNNNNSGQKLSKKEQVEQLKNRLSNLPCETGMKDRIGGIANAVAATVPKIGLFKKLLDGLKSKFVALLPGPAGLLAKVKTATKLLGGLKLFKPKKDRPGLMSKIGSLFNKGEQLEKKVQNLDSKAKKLKDKYDKLINKANALETEAGKRSAAIEKLKNKLAELEKKKAELQAKLDDKPKKMLDELNQQVGDVEDRCKDLAAQVDEEETAKDKALKDLADLEKEKDNVEKELGDLEDELEDLGKDQAQLEKDANAAADEVEKVKAEEAEEARKEKALEDLLAQLDALKPEDALRAELSICEEDLKALLSKINPLQETQKKLKKKAGWFKRFAGNIKDKLSNLKLFQNKLKLGKDGIPVLVSAAEKLDKLLAKGDVLSSTIGILAGKETKLQSKIDGMTDKLENIKSDYESKVANLEKLQENLLDLVAEKSGLKGKLGTSLDKLDELDASVKDLISRYRLFDDKDCLSLDDLKDKIEQLKNEQEATEPEVEALEDELNKVAEEEAKLEHDTKEVEKEIDKHAEQEAEVKKEEAAIKEAFGQEMDLEPVTQEEWSESFEVKRPYWDAVFHPDDEVVEGYKGKYFQVRLKDANKNVKLLFGAGEYFMEKSDFRDNYGSVIGAFVTEALVAMKKADREKVKLFIQGGADIVGQNTFKGNMDERYLYEEVSYLPQNEGQDSFAGTPQNSRIPRNGFRNTDLPNLRGNYLSEMISIYSKKLDPILLEGKVKQVKNEYDRNAVIYLFIPEELVE